MGKPDSNKRCELTPKWCWVAPFIVFLGAVLACTWTTIPVGSGIQPFRWKKRQLGGKIRRAIDFGLDFAFYIHRSINGC